MQDVIYGLLSYKTNNIGDEIQSLAARQYLPRVDILLDRDNLKNVKNKKKIKLILNGWFNPNQKNWPPSPDIDPLFISFHISKRSIPAVLSPESLAYFRKHQPIGCRDLFTEKLLKEQNIHAYFSGCLTLTLNQAQEERSDEIIFADLAKEVKGLLPKELISRAHRTSHWSYPPYAQKISMFLASHANGLRAILRKLKINSLTWFLLGNLKNNKVKFEKAQELLDRYAKAKLVITSRLHCALPCLAFNTPVIFISHDIRDPRFNGFLPYLRNYSLEDLKKYSAEINWEYPPPNPRDITPLQEALRKTCEDFINH